MPEKITEHYSHDDCPECGTPSLPAAEGDNAFRQKLVKFLNSFADCDDEGA